MKESPKFWEKWIQWVRKMHTWDTKKYPEEPSFYNSIDSGDREERYEFNCIRQNKLKMYKLIILYIIICYKLIIRYFCFFFYRFVVKDRDTAYTPAQRSLIVMQILSRARYDENHEKAGIRRLLADGTYLDCFSLHEGPYNRPGFNGEILDRYLLYLIWARPSQW